MKVFHFYPIGIAEKILNECNFDCIIFGAAYTSFYNVHFDFNYSAVKHHFIDLSIDETDDANYGYYAYEDEVFLCNRLFECTDAKKKQKQLFSTIMHEMMHWNQFNVMKWHEEEIVIDDKYYSSPAEKMCRKYEKHTKYVMQLYKTMSKITVGKY
jgi:hypothetical protein